MSVITVSLFLLQTLTFEEDETEKNVTFTLLDDSLPEDNENFQLRLTGVMGGALIGNISTSQLYMCEPGIVYYVLPTQNVL